MTSPTSASPRIVCVPDSFKGSATAAEAAAALGRGARQVFADAEITELPFADGGEGTLEALLAVWTREPETVDVVDAVGRSRTAQFGRSDDGRTAVLEAAEGNGLPHVSDIDLQPLRADTYGVGLIAARLLELQVEEILVCIGGSASTDGGTGMLTALGARFLNADGAPVSPGGQGLAEIAEVDLSGVDPRARRVRWRIAVDVDNPLVGERGAAAVFGPQKGAMAQDVETLDAGLAHLAGLLAQKTGAAPADYLHGEGFGAAGGIPLGLVSLLGAEVVPGSQMVGEAVGLDHALRDADVVLTGEGALDSQSLGGKVVDAVVRSAPVSAAVVVVAGTVKLTAAEIRDAGLAGAFSIAHGAAELDDLLRGAPGLIEDTAANACALLAHRLSSCPVSSASSP